MINLATESFYLHYQKAAYLREDYYNVLETLSSLLRIFFMSLTLIVKK